MSLPFRKIFSLTILILTACSNITGPQPDGGTTTPLTKIRLPMGYIPNVQYAPFYVADGLGIFKDAGLEVEFDYSPETDGVALVGANELQFALVSGEQVLLAREQEIPVVYVLGWWQDYPVAVSAKKELQINEPADLKGLNIGIPGLYGASYIGLRALLSAANLEEADISLESIGFNQVEALVSDQVEAVVIYANNEPIQLEKLGYEVDTIRVADYLSLASNGLITNEETLRENPELVRKMVQSVLKAVELSINDPDGAYSISMDYVEGLDQADRQVQMKILESTIEFWEAEKLGYSDPQAWRNMQEVLINMGLLSGELDLEQAFTNQFLE
jgi:NitT/TauT family transport system substrate-binding protein